MAKFLSKTPDVKLPFVTRIGFPEWPVIGREEEIERLCEVLFKSRMNNCILIGEAGTGKTILVKEVARRLAATHVFYSLNVSELSSGTHYRGDFEKKFQNMIESFRQNREDAVSTPTPSLHPVLFCDEFHTLKNAGSAEEDTAATAANILKPYLTDGSLTLWGATTPEEFRKYLTDDEAFIRRFQPFVLKELTCEESEPVVAEFLTQKYPKISVAKLSMAVKCISEASRNTSGHYPDKCIEIADRATARLEYRLRFTKEKNLSLPEAVKQVAEEYNAEQDLIRKV